MNYKTKLSENIKNKIGIEPSKLSPNEVRIKIEDNLDVANAVFKNGIGQRGIIGLGSDLEMSRQSINESEELYSEFMEEYTEYLDAQ